MDKEKQLDDFFGFKDSPDNGNKSAGIKETFLKRLSRKSKIRLLPKILSNNERYLVLVLLLIIACSIIAIPFTTYYHFTRPAPDTGGSFTEGLVGEPRHLNPILDQTNDADRDMDALVYSGLLSYNDAGKLVPDLAKSYEISSDGLNYTVYLRNDVKWHDGYRLTADDILFTIQTIQNKDYGSPLRVNWSGIEVNKIDDYTIIFKLKNKYAQFLNNLTFRTLPKHVWENIKPINFALSEVNLKPIGTGPYKFKKLQKDASGKIQLYELAANNDFYNHRPYIDKISVKFYGSEDELIDAYNRNEIDNLALISPDKLSKIKFKQRLNIYRISMPRYFATFFNQNQSKILSDKHIRLALNHATDKKAIIDKVLGGNGIVVDSPMLGGILDISQDISRYDYNKGSAMSILASSGWNKMNEQGVLTNKKGDKLELKLTTSTWPELIEVANQIKDQWAKVGVKLNLEFLSTSDLQQAIKDKNYQILLFGEILNTDPDPYSLWHSSQITDGAGLNLALYNNKTADTILENANQTLNPVDRYKKYDDFQKIVIEDAPAVFLYSPLFVYGQSKNISGFNNKMIHDASERFSTVSNWYMTTKRVGR